MSAFVYLLHFDKPYPRGRHPQHYVGVTLDLLARLKEHQTGNRHNKGRLTQVLFDEGIGLRLARSWEFETSKEAFDFERKLKQRRHHKRECVICKELNNGTKAAILSV